jgi:hypothetical protein
MGFSHSWWRERKRCIGCIGCIGSFSFPGGIARQNRPVAVLRDGAKK